MLTKLGKPSPIYLLLFLLQLFLSLAWLSSIQREVHQNDSTSGMVSLPVGGESISNRNSKIAALQKAACETTATKAAVVVEDGCSRRVIEAIIELEKLKAEFRADLLSIPGVKAAHDVASAAVAKKPMLIIGIPTMPRAADYLTTVLAAIDRQMIKDPSDPMFDSVHVWIMNNANDASTIHESFNSNKAIYAGRSEFKFLISEHPHQDPLNAGGRDEGSADHPGYRVRKQTRDLVTLMQKAKEQSSYYLAMEDDFELCPNTLRIIEHCLRKTKGALLNQSGNKMQQLSSSPVRIHEWITMKFSYGFNGFMLHNNGDLQEFARYLLEHQARRPPDHLMTEWSCGEKPQAAQYIQNRAHMTYKFNIFNHLGKVSTLRGGNQPDYPSCFHEMNTEVVFEVDAFEKDNCAHDDLSPCLPQKHPAWVPPYGIDHALIEKAKST